MPQINEIPWSFTGTLFFFWLFLFLSAVVVEKPLGSCSLLCLHKFNFFC